MRQPAKSATSTIVLLKSEMVSVCRRGALLIITRKSEHHGSSAHKSPYIPSSPSPDRSGLKKKVKSIPVPKTLAEAGEADRMMWEWRHAGRGWTEIFNEWVRITGNRPGRSTLSVRFMKIQENFQAHGHDLVSDT